MEIYSANSDCGKNVIQKGNEIFKNQTYSRESLKQFHPAEILWLADRKGFDENSPSPTSFLLWDCFYHIFYFFIFIFLLFFIFFILLLWINMRVCHIKAVRKCWLSTLVWLQWWKGREFFFSLFWAASSSIKLE